MWSQVVLAISMDFNVINYNLLLAEMGFEVVFYRGFNFFCLQEAMLRVKIQDKFVACASQKVAFCHLCPLTHM